MEGRYLGCWGVECTIVGGIGGRLKDGAFYFFLKPGLAGRSCEGVKLSGFSVIDLGIIKSHRMGMNGRDRLSDRALTTSCLMPTADVMIKNQRESKIFLLWDI